MVLLFRCSLSNSSLVSLNNSNLGQLMSFQVKDGVFGHKGWMLKPNKMQFWCNPFLQPILLILI
jgi:hypothetical protein